MNQLQRTILIVDDSPEDRETYRRYLLEDSRYRYTILEEEYGENGLKACQSVKLDAILLDFMLPDIDGLEFLHHLQAQFQHLCPPVVMLTGQGNEKVAVQAIKNGAQDYLVKSQITSVSLRSAVEQASLRRQLQQSEVRFRRLVESNIIGVVIGNFHRNITYANGAFLEMLGYGREQLERGELHWCDLTPPEYLSLDEYVIEELKRSGTCLPFEKQYLRRDGSRISVLQGCALLEEDDAQAIAFVMDLTERKQAELEIRKALEKEKELSELKSRFVSMVSHEFRNPLSTILGGVQILRNYHEQLAQDEKQEIFQQIQNGIDKMTTLLEDILELGKADTGKLEFNPAAVELENFCRILMSELSLGVGAKHQINFVYRGVKFPILDEKLLHPILSNLLSNALKYSPEGSTVHFEVTAQQLKVDFRIQDSGIGIPKLEQRSLFDPFRRASNVGKIPGTGLGLAIVKQCVDIHRGAIAIDSQIGVGTTISVTLPSGSEIKRRQREIEQTVL
ncbi:response regulator [Pleurocapsales cyanobacterium LEGE 06147]|nr:response regulator [Pleurocapsales cyanobacterium LEGE 06147]